MSPFTDARVRQAVALSLDRPEMVQGAAQRLRRPRQRQPVRAGVPLDRHARSRSARRTREGQAAAGSRRPSERLQHDADDRGVPGDPGTRPGDRGRRGQDRHQDQAQGRDPDQVLRQGDLRQLGLARRDREPRRLRRPRRPERVPGGAARPRAVPGTPRTSRTRPTTISSSSTSRPSTCRPRSRSRARSRRCCSTRRRS